MRKILKKRIRDTWFGEWMIGGLLLVILAFSSLVFFFFTYLAGFQDIHEVQTEVNPVQIEISEPVSYTVNSSSAEEGLSSTGAFAVIHKVKLTNTDNSGGEFKVTSRITKGPDASELSEKKTLASNESYTFTFEHDRSWSDFDAEYEVEVGNKTTTQTENETVEYTIDKRVWAWPWWETSLKFDLS